MSFSLVYLVHRFFYRILLFIHGWYIGSFRVISRRTIDTLESLDRYWAVKITLRNLFQPLYQDRSMVGRILGFIFRSSRIVIASFIYLIVVIAAVIGYLLFAAFPIYLIRWGFLGN